MRASILFSAIFAASTLAAPIVNTISATQDVKGDLEGLDSDVVSMAEGLNAFDGDSFKALDLMKAADKLIADMQSTLSGAQSGGKISFKDGLLILPVFRKFIPDTKKAMTALTSKKAELEKAGVTSVVLEKVGKIKDLGGQVDDAVVAQLDAISKPFGKAVYKVRCDLQQSFKSDI
jgi:hypothetical protein